MNLIKLSDNVLVNAKCISCVEQKTVNKKSVVIVWVEGKSYTLGVSLKEFLTSLDNTDLSGHGQEFGG